MVELSKLFSSEVELLLCCVRIQDPTNKDRILTLIKNGIDWSQFFQLAQSHHALALVYHTLSELCLEELPEDIMASLKEEYDFNAFTSFLLIGELKRLLNIFQENNIEAIPIKGPTLARLYEDYAMREVGDLDIWLNMEDIVRVKQILITDGYKPKINFSGSQEVVWLKCGMGYDFVKLKNRFMIDIHSNITSGNSPFLLPIQKVRSTLQTISIKGMDVLSPSPEYLFIFICIHGTKHLWRHLKFICDVERFIYAHPNLDWDWILQESQRLGCKRLILISLWIVNQLIQIELPNQIMSEIQKDLLIEKLGLQIITDWTINRSLSDLERFVIKLRLPDTFGHRLNYILRLIFIPRYKDIVPLPIPNSLYFLYFLLRPIFLIKDGVIQVFRKLMSPLNSRRTEATS